MRKKINAILVMCLLIVVLGAPTHFASSLGETAYFFSDHFDDDEVGKQPSKWSATNKTGAAGRLSTILVQPSPDGFGNVLEINMQETAASGQDPFVHRQLERVLTDQVVIESKMQMLDHGMAHHNIMVRDENNTNTNHLVRFHQNGFIYGYNGTQSIQVMEEPYDLKRWYHVVAAIHLPNKTYDLYIDGEKVLEDSALYNNNLQNIMNVRLQSWALVNNGESTVYYDDIQIREPGIREIVPFTDPQNVDVHIPEVSIEFNTPMSAEHLTPDQVSIRNVDTGITVTEATYSASTDRYTIYLTKPLDYGTAYEIIVENARDIFGHEVNASYSFYTVLSESTFQLSDAVFTRNALGDTPETLSQLKQGHITGHVNVTNLDSKAHNVYVMMVLRKGDQMETMAYSQKEMAANETIALHVGLKVPELSADYQIDMFATRDMSDFSPVSNVWTLNTAGQSGNSDPASENPSFMNFTDLENGDMTVDASFDDAGKHLMIEGHATHDETERVTVIVLDPQGALHYINEDKVNQNGNYQFTYPFGEHSINGFYRVMVGGSGTTNETTIHYTKLPEGPVTTDHIVSLVNGLADDGEINDASALRALTLHLTAVKQFELHAEGDKIIQHMNSFKILINHQKEHNLITESAYLSLLAYIDALIEDWK